MTATIIAAALSALVTVQQQTDTLVAVPSDVRISVNNVAGDVTVSSWDQNQVRVVAEHGSDDIVEIDAEGNALEIQAVSATGHAIADLELTVPTGASLEIHAPFADVTIEGTQGDVTVETVEGDIHLEGGRGQVQLDAVDGDIMISGAEGNIQAASVDGDVTLEGVSGAIQAEAVDGDVVLMNASSESVEAATIDGDIEWDGDIQDGGSYSFVTHDGDLLVGLQPGANARISVASFDADFTTDFESALQELEASEGAKRFSFVLGSGSARVELESFDGTIHLTRRGSF